MTSISKNVYIDHLSGIAGKYNNAYHKTIKLKPVDLKSKIYINFSNNNNYKDPKYKVSIYVRISKYKNHF